MLVRLEGKVVHMIRNQGIFVIITRYKGTQYNAPRLARSSYKAYIQGSSWYM